MHDAGRRAFQAIADRVRALCGVRYEFARIGHELPRDRIVGIASVDEVRNVRRDGDRVAGSDLGHSGAGGFGNQVGSDQIIDRRQLARKFGHAGGHLSVS